MMSIATGTAVAQDLEVCVSKGYTLTNVKPAVGAEPITYAWFENGSPIGSNSASYTIAAGAKEPGDYAYVRVAANAACTLSSNTYTVRVKPIPTIIRSGGDASQTVYLAQAVTAITYTATNSATITRSGSLPTGVKGTANGSTYTISGAPTAAGTFGYSVTASIGGCKSTASSGTITVLNSVATSTDGPNTAYTTKTWIIDPLIWSDRLIAAPTECASTSTLATNFLPPPQYVVSDGRYYYNWDCASAASATLCPSPWRLPTRAEVTVLTSAVSAIQISEAWGLQGYYAAVETDVEDENETGYWTSERITGGSTNWGYAARYTDVSWLKDTGQRRMGYLIRCVK
jgi:hypothetical protein